MEKGTLVKSGYDKARAANLRRATCIRVFGIPTESVDEEHVSILWGGISVDGVEHRQLTDQIWHISKNDIVETGDAGDASSESQVVWFDLRKDATPVEEVYAPVSLVHVARMRLGGRFGHLGPMGEIPVTIEPTSTTIPSSPPVTINP